MEICSPAGNMLGLKAAVDGGANAVYLGLDKFCMRKKAENFTLDTLSAAVSYAHSKNVKVFLALNSSIKQGEYQEVLGVIDGAGKLGVDAFIISDLSLIKRIKQIAPNCAIHISTQAGIHNKYGAKLVEELGAKRVVLSREADIKSIADIKRFTNLEVEVFVHGAICVSFSGGCLFSSVVSGKSGNRGACLQLCRLPYKAALGSGEKNTSQAYLLSIRDLCLIEHLDQLKNLGVDAIKIEGRLKRPEYAAQTAISYSKALKAKITNEDICKLKKIYSRGDFCRGYLFGENNLIEPRVQGHKGLRIGEVVGVTYSGKYSNIRLKLEYLHHFSKGDGYKILRNGYEICGGAIISFKLLQGTTFFSGSSGGKGSVLKAQSNTQKVKVNAQKAKGAGEIYQIIILQNVKIKVGDAFHITTDKRQVEGLNSIKRIFCE